MHRITVYKYNDIYINIVIICLKNSASPFCSECSEVLHDLRADVVVKLVVWKLVVIVVWLTKHQVYFIAM